MTPSLLDNDLYKFATQQAVCALFPETEARYQFFDRDKTRRYPSFFGDILRERLETFRDLKLSTPELEWLLKQDLFPKSYCEHLRNFRYNPDQVRIRITEDEQLDLVIEGPWKDILLWEVPLLALISEAYFEAVDTEWNLDLNGYYILTLNKASELLEMGACFEEFGTRRRRSYPVQDIVIRAIRSASVGMQDASKGQFQGTSNLHFAHRYGLPSSGTMPHEWIMAHQVLYGLREATPRALDHWFQVHQGRHAIALTDTFTVNLFFSQFTGRQAELYLGLRHDSGDPFQFCEQAIAFYQERGIDPETKLLLFSDGIDVQLAKRLLNQVTGRIQLAFGIGTFLTNDFPLGTNRGMIIKLTGINGKPAVKITSDPAKAVGDPEAVKQLFQEIVRLGYSLEAEAGFPAETKQFS